MFFIFAGISSAVAAGSEPANQTIKVLIYNGDKVAQDSADGIKKVLDSANEKNLVPGYNFSYNTSTIIDSATLQSYNVLAMPGGNDYITDYYGKTISSIDPTAIKNFVNNGGGYVGVCAGAFAGASYTKDCYYGWGVAPNVNCSQAYFENNTIITISSAGKNILGIDGKITTLYFNGPAMNVSGNASVLATYDGIIDSAGKVIISSGMAAIVVDYYGNGRSALMGPHPEFDPQSHDIVVNLIKWAANLKSDLAIVAPPIDLYAQDNVADAISSAAISSTLATNAIPAIIETLPMQNTGMPVLGLIIAFFVILCGLFIERK